jgi:hypothetical protein
MYDNHNTFFTSLHSGFMKTEEGETERAKKHLVYNEDIHTCKRRNVHRRRNERGKEAQSCQRKRWKKTFDGIFEY